MLTRETNELGEVRHLLKEKYQQIVRPDKITAIEVVFTQAIELNSEMNRFKENFYSIFSNATVYLGSIESLQKKCNLLHTNISKLYESNIKNEILEKIDFIQLQLLKLINETGLLTKECDNQFLTPAWNEAWNIKNSLEKEKLRLHKRWPEIINEYLLRRNAVNDNESLETFFKLTLRSFRNPLEAETFRQNFGKVNKFTYEIANKEVYKVFCTTSIELDFHLGVFFLNPDCSDLKLNDVKFLLSSRPDATANLYVFKQNIGNEKKIYFIRRKIIDNKDSLLKAFKEIQKRSLSISTQILNPDEDATSCFEVNSILEYVFDRKDYALINVINQSNIKIEFLTTKIAFDDLNFRPNFSNSSDLKFKSNLVEIFENVIDSDDVKLLEIIIKCVNLNEFENQLSNVNIRVEDKVYISPHFKPFDLTLPMYAVHKNASKIIDKLLELNVDMSSASLHEAAAIGHEKLIDYLIKHGADVNKKNKDLLTNDIIICYDQDKNKGLTPLLIAIKYKQIKAAELLLRKGAILDDAVDTNDIPSSLKIAILTWNFETFTTIFKYYSQLKEDKVAVAQLVFDWMMNFNNVFPDLNHKKDQAFAIFKIYLHVIQTMSLNLGDFISILRNKQLLKDNFSESFFRIVFNVIFSKDSSTIGEIVSKTNQDDLMWLLSFHGKAAQPWNYFIYIALQNDKFDNARVILTSIESDVIGDLTNILTDKNILAKLEADKPLLNLLAEKNRTTLTETDLSQAIATYKNYRHTFFPKLKWSEQAKQARNDLRNQKDDYNRFLSVTKFVGSGFDKFGVELATVLDARKTRKF